MSTKPDLLQCLCLGCEKNEPHYKFYRSDCIIYAYYGTETIGVFGRIMCPSALHYDPRIGMLEKLSEAGSYRNSDEKRIKLTPDFFSLSTIEKEKNLRGGKYDI